MTLPKLLPVVLLLLVATPWSHAEESVTHNLFQVTSQVLPNGLHVIRHHRDISDTFTVQLIVEIGLQDFDCAEQQLPHLLEHMLFEGTRQFDRQTLRQRIRDHGGKHNGFTTEEYTHFTFDIHSDYPEIALENLASMLTESLFLPEHLATSRQVIHAEMGTSSNALQLAMSGKQDLHAMAKARIWAGSHLECPDLTIPDHISLQRIESVFAQAYVASNMTLLILGHFDDARVDRALENTLAKLPTRATPVRTAVAFGDLDTSPIVVRKGLLDPEVEVSLYIRSLGTTHPDYPAFDIAAEYLGERLFYSVRGEQGLAYTPYAYVESNSQFGFLRTTTKTTDRWHDEVVRLFQDQYAKLMENGIPVADVERIKQKLILDFESKQRDNGQLSQYYRHFRHIIRDQGTMPDLIQRLRNIDAQQVNAAIQRHFPAQPLLASARPPSLSEVLIRIVPVSLLLGAIGILLLRWSHRRRQAKSRP